MEYGEAVRSVVHQFAKKEVAEEQSLFTSGILDSFTLPDLVSALEEKTGLTVPDSDLNPQTFDSIRGIEDYLRKRAAQRR